ncbi:MAG: RlmE family RNA methyltransferase [Candidatus Bathyarchaeia archaeon]
MPGQWLLRKRDYYYRRAKEENYRSRAAYKLLQAVKKYGFIKYGDVVVDLGAAPGGWLQAARKLVGDKGFVLGVDLREIKPLNFENVHTIVGDIRDSETIGRIKAILPRPADVVISDVSPNVSGVWELDHARQIELAEASLNIALAALRKGGNFFTKVFQGDLFQQFLGRVREHFNQVKVIKPEASRKSSAEIYVLGLNYRG